MTNPKGQDLSPQLNFAMYLPAISPGYGEIAVAAAHKYRQMPNGLEPADLNFLDPQNKLFYLPAALYSAGIVADLTNPKATMVSKRDKKSSHVLADSGGYQIISGKLSVQTSWQRKQIFDWQQSHCDAGMSLDVPTKALEKEASGYVTFEECLQDTLQHLRDYEHFQEKTKFPLLNVIQGRTATEADAWYAMAKEFSFNGWAFAGDLKEDLYQVVRRILILLRDGRLNNRECWIHFLGLGKFKLAVLLTVLRNCIRKKTGDQDFHISMDTSSPGRSAMQYRRVYTKTKFTAHSFVLGSADFPFNDPQYLGSSEPFPYPTSPIGRVLTMGDLIVKKGTHMNSRMDMLSACMLANHNYYVYSNAMLEANQLLEQHPGLIVERVPVFIQDAKRAIEDIFDSSEPFSKLEKFKRLLDRV